MQSHTAGSQNNSGSLAPGQMVFYDDYVPALEAGDDYVIEMKQEAPVADSGNKESYSTSQRFSVQGPRYALPSEDVFSIFPPDRSQGIFHQFLPHVVLTKAELPWEQNIFNDKSSQSGQTPWLALLLFVENEQTGGQPTLLPPSDQNPKLSGVIKAHSFYDWPAGVASERTKLDNGVLWPQLPPKPYETEDYLETTMSVIIDLSPQAFKTLLPPYADLRYLAHVRQVDASAKDQQVLSLAGDGWYSVVVCNRLANAPPQKTATDETAPGAPGKRNVVHLVSLEGFEKYINGQQDLPTDTTRVRMISFLSWSFTCLPDGGKSFSKLMQGLVADAANNPKSTSFVLPATSPGDDAPVKYASHALGNGYVPLRYETRLGEQTFGWYRGPFSPVPAADFVTSSGLQPFHSASGALIYDPNYGVFDVSYAVAFETGRLLALANGQFGQQLMEWQRKGHQYIDLILERASQVPALHGLQQAAQQTTTTAALSHLMGEYALTGDFVHYLATQLAGKMKSPLADRRAMRPVPCLQSYVATTSPVPKPQHIRELLKQSVVRTAVREHGSQGVDTIVDWLAQLYLLVNVPFLYLDPNWLAALVEGALAIGIESSRDAEYQDLMKDVIWKATHDALPKVRARLHPNTPPSTASEGPMTGMLLRSASVAGWPGLSVNGYTKAASPPDPESRIPLRRMERLSDDVLLCLWPTVPALVSIDEPHEGVAFGFEDPPHGEGYYLYLRSLDPGNYGTLLKDKWIDAQASKVINENNTLKLNAPDGLIQLIGKSLPGPPTVHIRDFAVEMVRVPERAVFAPPTIN
jgi:hypothetical protein